MSLLEDLKKKADEKKSGDGVQGASTRSNLDGNVLVLAPKFIYIKKYLTELAENLNVINPDEQFSFSLTRRVTLNNFIKRNFRLDIVKEKNVNECMFRYDLVQDRDIKQTVDSIPEADLAMKVMAERNIHFTHNKIGTHKIQLNIKPKITTSFIFSVDIEKCVIVLRIKNFDGTWDQLINYAPNKVTEKLLDELGKYILNQPNQFMAKSGNTLSDSMRGRLKAKLDTDDRGSRHHVSVESKPEKSGGLFGMFKKS